MRWAFFSAFFDTQKRNRKISKKEPTKRGKKAENFLLY